MIKMKNELEFSVETKSGIGFVVEARSRSHTMVVDEPKELGGTDKGPNPIELLLASLASCLSIAIKFHADRMNVPVSRVKVVAKGTLDLRGFMGEDVKPGLQKITLDVTVESPASEERVKELIDFVEHHCPVADTLRSNTPVELTVKRKRPGC